MQIKNCKKCDKDFFRNPQYSNKQWKESKFCSRKCQYIGAERVTIPTYEDTKERKCNACGVIKSVEHFWPHSRKKGAVQKTSSKCRDCGMKLSKDIRFRIKMEVINTYGGKCTCCGESHYAFLSIDHINNDGNLHRKELKRRGIGLYRWLKKEGYPQNDFQLLCYNCNMAKAFNGSCPHSLQMGGTRQLIGLMT